MISHIDEVAARLKSSKASTRSSIVIAQEIKAMLRKRKYSYRMHECAAVILNYKGRIQMKNNIEFLLERLMVLIHSKLTT